jgi:hypothetical protein
MTKTVIAFVGLFVPAGWKQFRALNITGMPDGMKFDKATKEALSAVDCRYRLNKTDKKWYLAYTSGQKFPEAEVKAILAKAVVTPRKGEEGYVAPSANKVAEQPKATAAELGKMTKTELMAYIASRL